MAVTWNELEAACSVCTGCRLCETRTNVVFGAGIRDAEVMFVGEGPGEQEDLQGLPFVGPAGHLLDDMLSIIDLDRNENIYIANVVKCRPPGNRDPQIAEQQACIKWLREQYRLIHPKILVCLGRIAAQALIKPDFKISREHGSWTEKGGTYFTAVYHPSALLRNPENRPDTFLDLKSIQRMINEKCSHTYP